ncbi:hypothetical protein EZJ19_11130 [Parasulfuritortus cantonensis]|uniref:Lipoprotein n=1 Tax=Parasulfuritortus cantonensis TaxID=2528202 RepID=A0A4V2NVA9_9PROT|nr:hypothetical protein [Parasulfuritortus cantonensis]TCJ12786.1 hypothetical protein EZJ19_11130 [Parasulfuritortus cantonensis]
MKPSSASRRSGRRGIRAAAAAVLGLAVTALSGCSEMGRATAYESMQGSARQACYKLPDERDRLDCLRQHEMTYEQYRQQRGQLDGDAASKP